MREIVDFEKGFDIYSFDVSSFGQPSPLRVAKFFLDSK